MQKLLVLTDLHLRAEGKTIIGINPLARAREVLEAALLHHSDADAVVLLGDLTHSGRAKEYGALKELLSACELPIIPMLGNHDQRDVFLQVFPEAPVTEQGHVQRIVDLPNHRLITLDSHEPSAQPPHSGFLCSDRMQWLDRALADAGTQQPLVFIHHPPMPIGLPGMDAIRLTNGPELLERLRGTGAHLLCGHIHRTISGQTGGVPFTVFKSPCHQAPLDLVNADSTLSVDEPGAYGLVLLTPDGVICHSEDVGLGSQPVSGADALPEGETEQSG